MKETILTGKAAIVTGAARGIGRATALLLAERGCGLVLSGREEKTLEKVAMEVSERGGRAVCVAADLRAAETPGLLVQKAQLAFHSLDVLVNAAGFARPGPLLHMDLDVW